MSELAHSAPELTAPAGGVHRVRVNPSLSRGLADRAIDVLGRQGDKYRASLCSVLSRRARNKKSIGRMRQQFIQLGERTKLVQIIGSTPNGRQVTVCQFVPKLADTEPHRRSLDFVLYQFVLSRHGLAPGPDFGTALVASEHTIQRLFLRLNTLDLGAVLRELHDAMLLALPLWVIALSLKLHQVPLPTSSGAFLCQVDAEHSHLVAKTWVPHSHLSARWLPVISAITEGVASSGGYSALAVALCAGIEQSLDDDSGTLFQQLAEALAGYPWLRSPYAPRVDRLAAAWRAYEASNQEARVA